MTQTHTLLKGWGYWDTTHYPYGGSFRRATEDTPVQLIANAGKYPDERKIGFADGSIGIVKARGLQLLESEVSK